MISLIGTVLKIALPFIDFFWRKAEQRSKMKEKMFELAEKYDKQVLKNAKLNAEYEKLKKELLKIKQS